MEKVQKLKISAIMLFVVVGLLKHKRCFIYDVYQKRKGNDGKDL